MQEKGYRGWTWTLNIWAGTGRAYAQFLRVCTSVLAPYGLPLIAALAPKTSADQPGTLYEGATTTPPSPLPCDAVLLMTYEWGYTYGPPMAVAPIGAVRRVVEFALTQMEPGEDSAGVSKLCLRLDTAVHGGGDAGAVHRERGRPAACGAVRRGNSI